MQVQDDVNDRLEFLGGLHQRARREIPVDRRIELTSLRVIGRDSRSPRRMAISFPDPAALDVILATNMISVGVDILRSGPDGRHGPTAVNLPSTSRQQAASAGVIRAWSSPC